MEEEIEWYEESIKRLEDEFYEIEIEYESEPDIKSKIVLSDVLNKLRESIENLNHQLELLQR